MIPENQCTQFSEQQMEILQEYANGIAQEILCSITQEQPQQQQPSQEMQMLSTMQAMLIQLQQQ